VLPKFLAMVGGDDDDGIVEHAEGAERLEQRR
jgi:hypothetical protein